VRVDQATNSHTYVFEKKWEQIAHHFSSNNCPDLLGLQVSIKEFDFAHLDFTFENKQELMSYVMSRLALGSSAEAHTPAAQLRSIVQGERVAEKFASEGQGSSLDQLFPSGPCISAVVSLLSFTMPICVFCFFQRAPRSVA
jgi:hypothetical protein